MKKNLLRCLSAFLAVCLVLSAAPLSGFVGIELPEGGFGKMFSAKAQAEVYSEPGVDTLVSEYDIKSITASGAQVIYRGIGGVLYYEYDAETETEYSYTHYEPDPFNECYTYTVEFEDEAKSPLVCSFSELNALLGECYGSYVETVQSYDNKWTEGKHQAILRFLRFEIPLDVIIAENDIKSVTAVYETPLEYNSWREVAFDGITATWHLR